MTKIVVSSIVSLDGYTEGRDGDVMAMPMDAAFGQHNADRVRAASHLIFGATTYRGMTQYWPAQVDNPDATPDDRYIAARYATDLELVVVSDGLTAADVTVWSDRTTLVPRADVESAVSRLRANGLDTDAVIFGSRTLWVDLLRRGLVDELHLMVGPKIVAGDHRALVDVPETDLTLLGVRTWSGSGNVVLHYALG